MEKTLEVRAYLRKESGASFFSIHCIFSSSARWEITFILAGVGTYTVNNYSLAVAATVHDFSPALPVRLVPGGGEHSSFFNTFSVLGLLI